jgi:hypothetical protein
MPLYFVSFPLVTCILPNVINIPPDTGGSLSSYMRSNRSPKGQHFFCGYVYSLEFINSIYF